MNTLLALTADFFEHLTNPAFGREANDSYDFKFHMLMQDDAETARQLARAPLSRDDVGSMSAAAWLWYLAWRESITDELPSDDFLDALYDETTNPILRLRIMEVSVRSMQSDQAEDGLVAEPENTRRNWVRNRIRSFLGERDLGGRATGPRQASVDDAWELLTYLIDIGSGVSLDAANVLLAERWEGALALRERALEFIADMQLPSEYDLELRARLGL